MKMPVLSVIVPVYNVEPYIYRCLDSIRHQTFCDFEVILVDDGSTDRSGNICDEYAIIDKRFRVLHQKNKGAASARIAGISLAAGEYITFVDSDDWLEPSMYGALMQSMLSNSEIDICVSGFVQEDSLGHLNYMVDTVAEQDFSAEKALIYLLKTRFFSVSLCNKIYKMSLFIDLSMPILTYGEDLAANWYLFHGVRGRIHYFPIAGYHYNYNPSSVTHVAASLKFFAANDFLIEKESTIVSSDLRRTVRDRIIRNGMYILYQMLNEGAEKKDIEYVQKKLRPYMRRNDIAAADEIINTEYDKMQVFISSLQVKRSMVLREFNIVHTILYIYGAGQIGHEIAAFMDRMEIKYEGFIVSQKMDASFDSEVFLADDIIDLIEHNDQVGVVFALNRFNYEQVTEKMSDMVLSHSLNMGQYNKSY